MRFFELVQVEEVDKEMNSTFWFNHKIHNFVSRTESNLALPATTNSTNFNLVTKIVFPLIHRITTILMLNFQIERYPSLIVNRLNELRN